MRPHRFFVRFDREQKEFSSNDTGLVGQLKNVLRLGVGDVVVLFDGNGQEATAEIKTLTAANVSFTFKTVIENVTEPARSATMYCAILKKENFEIVCQKATEAGIAVIVPIISKRTVKLNLNVDRLKKIVKEAAEQSGRGIIPSLAEPMLFSEALKKESGNKMLFDTSGQPMKSSSFAQKTAIFIGPEGGWDEQELELAKQSGCQIVTLGKLTLRAETAAIIASYLATHYE